MSSSKGLKNKFQKSEKKAKVYSLMVDNYNNTKNKIKVLGDLVDNYNIYRMKGFEKGFFHSPCEIALLCFSIDHARHHKELITELRDLWNQQMI